MVMCPMAYRPCRTAFRLHQKGNDNDKIIPSLTKHLKRPPELAFGREDKKGCEDILFSEYPGQFCRQ